MVHVCGPERVLLPWTPDLLPADLSSGFQCHFLSPLCTGIFPRVAVHGSTGGISFHLPGGSPSLCTPRPPLQPSFVHFGEGGVPRVHRFVTLNTDSLQRFLLFSGPHPDPPPLTVTYDNYLLMLNHQTFVMLQMVVCSRLKTIGSGLSPKEILTL